MSAAIKKKVVQEVVQLNASNSNVPNTETNEEKILRVRKMNEKNQIKDRIEAKNVHKYMLSRGLVVDSHSFSVRKTNKYVRKLRAIKTKYLDFAFALRHQDLFECKITYLGDEQIGWRYTPIPNAECSGVFVHFDAYKIQNTENRLSFITLGCMLVCNTISAPQMIKIDELTHRLLPHAHTHTHLSRCITV